MVDRLEIDRYLPACWVERTIRTREEKYKEKPRDFEMQETADRREEETSTERQRSLEEPSSHKRRLVAAGSALSLRTYIERYIRPSTKYDSIHRSAVSLPAIVNLETNISISFLVYRAA